VAFYELVILTSCIERHGCCLALYGSVAKRYHEQNDNRQHNATDAASGVLTHDLLQGIAGFRVSSGGLGTIGFGAGWAPAGIENESGRMRDRSVGSRSIAPTIKPRRSSH
jgi:hypothetical protein